MPLVFQKQQVEAPASGQPRLDGISRAAGWLKTPRHESNLSSDQIPYALLSLGERERTRVEGLREMRDLAKFMSLTMITNWTAVLGDNSLQTALQGMVSRLFPDKMDRSKIKRVFRKIAQNVLGDGISCECLEGDTSDLLKYSEDDLVPQSLRRQLCKQFPELAPEFRYSPSWRDLKCLLSETTSESVKLTAVKDAQLISVTRDLGLPARHHRCCAWSDDLRNDLARTDKSLFQDDKHDLARRDIVVVRQALLSEFGGPCTHAFTIPILNVVSLKPQFFSGFLHQNLLHGPLPVEGTTLEKIVSTADGACRAFVFLHELMHTASVLYAEDQLLPEDEIEEFLDARQSNRRPMNMAPSVNTTLAHWEQPHSKAYAFERCHILAQLDNTHGTSRAEENADSWALLAALSSLVLLYPEYDFLVEGNQVRLRQDGALLHHCSAFDCLRHEAMGSVVDLPGYQADKDLWRQRKPGIARPKTVQHCNEFLEELVAEQGTSLQSVLDEAGLGSSIKGHFCHT